jgi:hypothetical protein
VALSRSVITTSRVTRGDAFLNPAVDKKDDVRSTGTGVP